jgi:SAM-dependent methyltransferase
MTLPKLYDDLAHWWPLLSPPSDYEEEAATYLRLLMDEARGRRGTLLELGSGGGSNAFYLKRHFDRVTLVDVSPRMLAVSGALNPECEHVQGDMRTLRLGHEFDYVFVHDAISYMTSEPDLERALTTAYVHCRPGGVALFCPDHLREHFDPSTSHGGTDGVDRAIRYLEWSWDPDSTDTTHLVDYVYVLRDADGSVRVEHDRHVNGLFARDDWLRLLERTGFVARAVPFEHSEVPPCTMEIFIAHRPAE